jgi:hypothetical protein
MAYSDWSWRETLSKGIDEASIRLEDDLNELPSVAWAYKAVYSFMPYQCDWTKPKNESIASLIKLYCAKRSGHKQEARERLQRRFSDLDYPVQKKILRLFLDGSQADRKFCYERLRITWDNVFEKKIIELWGKHHESMCGELLVDRASIKYVRSHEEELAAGLGYFPVCRRLATEDRNYKIDRKCLSNPHYARMLYECKRTIDAEEATRVLWETILDTIVWGIGLSVAISNYFLRFGNREEGKDAESNDYQRDLVVPSIVWNENITLCMRYLYHIAPAKVLSEAMHWDMEVGKKFQKLVGGSYYHGDIASAKGHDARLFFMLAYTMIPEDKKQYHNPAYGQVVGKHDKNYYLGIERFLQEIDESEYRAYAESVTSQLLDAIKEHHLLDDMTTAEWQQYYESPFMPIIQQAREALPSLGLEFICPPRTDVAKEILYDLLKKASSKPSETPTVVYPF